MPIDLDTSQWPYVFSRFLGPQTMAELEAYITEKETQVHARRRPWVGLSWMHEPAQSWDQLQRMRRWAARTEDEVSRYCHGFGIVTSSPGFRIAMSTAFFLRPMRIPHQVCANFEHAVAFIRQKAAEKGLYLPPPARPWVDLP